MNDRAFEMTMLYDFYGDLLTDRQKEIYELYYNDDYSLSEIAEYAGISRQGVRDILVRSENSLRDYESKIGAIKRCLKLRDELKIVQDSINNIYDINHRHVRSTEIEYLLDNIQSHINEIKE